MLFSSITFLYYFFPIVLILYFMVPKCIKNVVLMLVSLVFYAWGEPIYVFLMIVSIIIGYTSGCLIETFCHTKKATCILWTVVIFSVGVLTFFKYTHILPLPIGISFYTFQILSYTIDVYRGKVRAQKKIVNLALYVAMFPQLIAGPIVRYIDIEKQLEERACSIDKFAGGIRRFVIGLGKKVLLANILGELCEIFKVSNDKSVLYFWLYAIAFMLHIYFDFSGYSDMAIGLGKVFGFEFMENFNYPYISKSITEFWRRWHMSLGQWFRDYVYIPLGGSRVSKGRWFLNIFVVWFLTGAWHGGTWNFIIWGLYFGLFLVLEKQFLLKPLQNSRIINRVYSLLVVLIGFVIFNAANLKEAVDYVSAMFGFGGYPLISKEFLYYIHSYKFILITGVIGATPCIKNGVKAISRQKMLRKWIHVAEPLLLVGMLLLITAYLVDGSFNPFLYFRF